MLAKIIAFIMSVLMMIFPFWGEKRSVSNEEVAKAVIYAVENKDAAAIEKYMCKNIKDNFADLTGEINTMLSLIEGDVESITWERLGAYSESDGKGKSISQNNQNYDIFTSSGVYGISIVIETHNSFSADELGIRAITLYSKIKNTNPEDSREYVYGETLIRISATEGVKDWHD